MKTFQLFLLITGLAYSTAVITVEVRLHSYSNPQSRDCDGDTCDPDIFGAECDNIFQFCLRAAGSGSCLTNIITTDEISEDILSFSASQLSELGISNPLRFSDITTSTELELFVRITDDDTGFDDLVDTFIIPFDRQQRPNSTFGPPITQSGSCGIGTSISISINITSTPELPTATATATSEGSSDTFVGSLVFIVVVGVAVAIPFLALFIIFCILCVMCALSSNWSCPRLDCSCPKLDCSCPSFDCSCPSLDCSCPSLDCSCPSFDCSCPKINCSCPKINCDLCNCSDFCKWLTCGFKLDDANPCILCILCILVILASPAVIVLLAVVGPVFLIVSCLLYFLLHVCE